MLNLIPPVYKRRKGLRSLAYTVSLGYIIVAVALILGLLGLTTVNFIQKSTLNTKQAELDNLLLEKNKNETVVSDAAFIQNRLKTVTTYQSAYDWNKILAAIAAETPTNCQLTSLTVGGDPKKQPTVTLAGTATDRRSIILFAGKLNLDPLFSGANVTSISQGETSFTFAISVELAKTTAKSNTPPSRDGS